MHNEALTRECRDRLREWLPLGSTLYLIDRGRKLTGGQVLEPLSLRASLNNEVMPHYLWFHIATLLDLDRDDGQQSVVMRGIGADQGEQLAQQLSGALYGNPMSIYHRWL